jgi:hypothetical protein
MNKSAEKENFKKRISRSKTALPRYRCSIKHRVNETLVIGQQQKTTFFRDIGQVERPRLKEKYAKKFATPAPERIPGVT